MLKCTIVLVVSNKKTTIATIGVPTEKSCFILQSQRLTCAQVNKPKNDMSISEALWFIIT